MTHGHLRPLYLWGITHAFPTEAGEEETIHYILLPSRDPQYAWTNLEIRSWLVRGISPQKIELLDQVSNMFCYVPMPIENSGPTDVQGLRYYNPRSKSHRDFDRVGELYFGDEE